MPLVLHLFVCLLKYAIWYDFIIIINVAVTIKRRASQRINGVSEEFATLHRQKFVIAVEWPKWMKKVGLRKAFTFHCKSQKLSVQASTEHENCDEFKRRSAINCRRGLTISALTFVIFKIGFCRHCWGNYYCCCCCHWFYCLLGW